MLWLLKIVFRERSFTIIVTKEIHGIIFLILLSYDMNDCLEPLFDSCPRAREILDCRLK